MALRKNKIAGAIKKLHLKAPFIGVCERPKFERTPPMSPTSILVYGHKVLEGSDDETAGVSSQSSSIPADVPKGYFAVHVGEECKRYVIPLSYLKHQVFMALLSRAEEEFGFSHSGAIRLPCDTVFFDHLIWLLGIADPSVQN